VLNVMTHVDPWYPPGQPGAASQEAASGQ
jgi:hypothetical protein